MGREEDQYQRRNCNCNCVQDKYIHGKTTYRENYAVPDDDFYEKEDTRWNVPSHPRSAGGCSHRRVSSIEKETLSSFRQRACQFMESESNSETESSSLDDCCSHCACSGVMKKAHDLLNYSPESNFLRKLKKQSEIAHEDGCHHNKRRDGHGVGCDCNCRCYMSGIEEEQDKVNYSNSETELLPSQKETIVKELDNTRKSDHEINSKKTVKKGRKDDNKDKKSEKQGKQVKKPDKKEVVKKDKSKKDNAESCRPNSKPNDKKKVRTITSKVPHRSRPKTKSPPAKRKPREIRDPDSGAESEASLKRPRPNSCERCWKYASPARSPVNKPQQRYDPNYRRAHSGEGDFNPETKILELLSPIGSVPNDEESPPTPVRQLPASVRQRPASVRQPPAQVRLPNAPRSKSQGTKKNVQQVPKPRPQSHTSIRPSATEQDNNYNSVDTQYYEPPAKITAKKHPSGPPKRIAAPIRKIDPPLQKKDDKTIEKPSSVVTKPSSPPKDSHSSRTRINDIDVPAGTHSHCPCSQRTEKTVPSTTENFFLHKRPKPVERVSSATFIAPNRERPTCHCKSADHRNRFHNEEETHVIPSRYSNEAINRNPKSAYFLEENERRKSACKCALNRRQHHEEAHIHRKRGKENSKKCCCKCHCGAQHCMKQKYIVNDRLFAEPVNLKQAYYETDSTEVPCDCEECRRRRRSLLRHCRRNSGTENIQKNEHACICKNRRNSNNSNSIEGPRKYSVFYTTECRNNPPLNGNGIEVVVEELTTSSKNRNSKDKKSSKDIETKIKNITQYRPDSMALRFQKGVTEKNKPPTSPRARKMPARINKMLHEMRLDSDVEIKSLIG